MGANSSASLASLSGSLVPAAMFFRWALSGDLLQCDEEEAEKGRILQIGIPERMFST